MAKWQATQCCGTCKWWETPEPPYTNSDCKFPLPICVYESDRHGTDFDSGANCPCYEPKGESNG